MVKAQFRIRHLEWFHEANSAESLIRATNPQEHPDYGMVWLEAALVNLGALSAELRDEKLTNLVGKLRGHYRKRKKEMEDLPTIIMYRTFFGTYAFLEPLHVALCRAKEVLHLLPRSDLAEFREIPKDEPLWTGLPCSK